VAPYQGTTARVLPAGPGHQARPSSPHHYGAGHGRAVHRAVVL